MSYPKNATVVTKNQAVPISASNTAIAAANEKRSSLLVTNTGSVTVYVAAGENATTAKQPLAAGRFIRFDNGQAVNGIVASGTGSVHVLEEGRA